MNTIPRYAASAVQFSGSSYISCGNGLSLAGGNPFTIEAWIYPTSNSGAIICRGNIATTYEYDFYLQNGLLTFAMPGQQQGIPQLITASIALNKWQQVSVTFDGTTAVLYVNGVQAAQSPWSKAPAIASAPVVIGASWSQANTAILTSFFQGMIGRVAVWSECRDLDQINDDSVQWEAHRLVNTSGNPNDPDLAVLSSNANLLALFDLSSLPAVEASGNNVPFTFSGTEYVFYVPGLVLDGATGYADCGNNPLLSFPGNAQYTIEGWFMPQNLEATLTPTIVSKLNEPSAAEYQVVLGNEQLWSYRNVLPSIAIAPPILANNEFYHFASTYDGAVQSLFLNGNLQTSQKFGAQGSAPSVNTLIGANYQANVPLYFFKGLIQNIRIWNVALEEKAIRQWMYNDPDPTSKNLVASIDFTVNPPVDETANNTITLNGGAEIKSLFITNSATTPTPGPIRPFVSQALEGESLDTVNEVTLPDVPVPASQQVDLFTPTHFERLKEDLTNGFLKDKDEATKQAAYARLQQAFDKASDMVQKDPKLLNPYTTTRENGIVTLTYHHPEGDQVIFQASDAATPACLIWWVSFIYSITAGFFIALGLLPGGAAIARKIYDLVSKSTKAMQMLENLIAQGSGIGIVAAVAVVKGLYDLGLVWPIMKLLFAAAGWWALGRLLIKVIALLTGVEAAELLAGFIIWGAQLVVLATQYTGSCSAKQLSAHG